MQLDLLNTSLHLKLHNCCKHYQLSRKLKFDNTQTSVNRRLTEYFYLKKLIPRNAPLFTPIK